MHIAISSDKIDLSSEEKTEKTAASFFKKIKPGDTVFLYEENHQKRSLQIKGINL